MSAGSSCIVALILTHFLIVSAVIDLEFLLRGKNAWVIERAIDNYPADGGGIGKYDSSYNISRECHNALLVYKAGLENGEEWAMRMMDSDAEMPGGPPPPGLLEGHVNWVGAWDECHLVKATNKQFALPDNTSSVEHDWDARQCRCRYGPQNGQYRVAHWFSICVPPTCTEEEVSHLMMSNITGPIYDTYCDEEVDFSKDTGAIVVTTVVVLFGGIIILATLVDYIRSVRRGGSTQIDEVGRVEANSNQDNVQKGQGLRNIICHLRSLQYIWMEITSGLYLDGTQEKRASGKGFRTLSAFSLIANVPRILTTRLPKDSYTCMHGIRFFSMAWIVLGHTWGMGILMHVDPAVIIVENPAAIPRIMGRLEHAVIVQNDVAVDTFFVLSACLVTISLMKQFTRLRRENGGPLQTVKTLAQNYLHRYWRLTPIYAAILFMYTYYIHHLKSGLLWSRTLADADNCRHNWWMNLLYLNTLYNIGRDEQCMSWSWYLGNDFAYYIIAPFFVFFMFRTPIFGCILLSLGYVGQLFGSAWAYSADLYSWDNYNRPWFRFGPYAIGIALGFIIFHSKCKVKLPKVAVIIGWLLAVVFCVLAIYTQTLIPTLVGCEECDAAKRARIAYQSIHRDIFALGIAWLIFACCTGYGGIVNRFLSWKCFVPLSRLTYTGYLCHIIIIACAMYWRLRTFVLQVSILAVLYLGYMVMTIGVSFVLSLVFEVPMLELEKVWLPRK